jgi:hypothetical protein
VIAAMRDSHDKDTSSNLSAAPGCCMLEREVCVRKIKPEEFRHENKKSKNITSDDSLHSHAARMRCFRREEEILKG